MMRNKLLEILFSKETNLAFCIQNKFYTYKDLRIKTKQVFNLLSERKIKNSFIPILTNDCIETYACILAIWFSGNAYVPISPNYPKDRILDILKQIESRLLISTSEKDLEFELDIVELLKIYEIEESVELEIVPSQIKDDDYLAMLFTSGSTGKPKGVPYSLKNINATLDSFWHLKYKLSEEDKFLQMFELSFDMSLFSFLPALLLGASIYTVGPKKIKYLEVIKLISHHKLTVASMVPSTLNYFLPFINELDFGSLRYNIFGGEPLYKSLLMKFQKVMPDTNFVNLSGPCETTMACVSYELNAHLETNKSLNDIFAFGKVWKNTQAIIVDDRNEIVENGTEGELCFAGENVMQGYFKNDDLNKKIFFEKNINGKKIRFYKTGDMSFMDENQILYSCGRKDNQYKIQGYKVELEEIESLVRNKYAVNYCAALVLKNGKNIQEIHFVHNNLNLKNESIISFLKTKLPKYALPKKMFQFIKMPVNLSGKLDRKKLKEMVKKEIEKVD